MALLVQLTPAHELALYHYINRHDANVPYHFAVSFERWRECMLCDVDDDGTPLFAQLVTLVLLNKGQIEGYIQYGVTSFGFADDGERDFAKRYAIIRKLHFLPEAEKASLLIEGANGFFAAANMGQSHAFFHYFGMSCYARQGKLHASQFYIEKLLLKYGYEKEHENVYYTRPLFKAEQGEAGELVFSYGNGGQSIGFYAGGAKIGGCELNTTFSKTTCFLKWIYIDERYAHQGFGTRCMHKLCQHLCQLGFDRLDTDTADGNDRAQGYYDKTGFANMGRMRSYRTV